MSAIAIYDEGMDTVDPNQGAWLTATQAAAPKPFAHVDSIAVVSAREIDIVFDQVMGASALSGQNYTISGNGKGSLASHPDSAMALGDGKSFRLSWPAGEMFIGGDIWITASFLIRDEFGQPIREPNEAQALDAGIGDPPGFVNFAADPPFAFDGQTTLISFESSEALLANPGLWVGTRTASFVSRVGNVYTYSYLVQPEAVDPIGPRQIFVGGVDLAGNGGQAFADGVFAVIKATRNVFVSPAAVHFGEVDVDDGAVQETIRVWNLGGDPLHFTGAGMTLAGDADIVLANSPSTAALDKGAYVEAVVSFDPSTIGPQSAAFTITTDDPDEPTVVVAIDGAGIQPPGAPHISGAVGYATGELAVQWTNPNLPPQNVLAVAYDIYEDDYVRFGPGGSMYYPADPAGTSVTLPLAFTGGYHVWLCNQYSGGESYFSPSPWTGILYGGVPHAQLDCSVESLGGGQVRLHWRPDIYGTWLYEIIVYKAGEGFITLGGPSTGIDGFDPWHFIDYGGLAYDGAKASFGEGWADFVLPGSGDYWFLVRAAGWLSPYLESEWTTVFHQQP